MSSSADQKNPQSALPPPKHVAHLESSDHCTTLPTNLHMPAEWEPHRCCLILYPHNRQTFRLDKAQAQFDLVIRAIAEEGQEAVRILCQSQEQADELIKSKPYIKESNLNNISVHVVPSNDTWARDTCPTFCRDDQHQLVGVDWQFNAYGGPEEGCYWPCDLDQAIPRHVCHILEAKRVDVPMILEGGSIHTDGEGTILTTMECLLHKNRNPHLSQTMIESMILTTLGASKMIWLPHGVDGDEDTNGHVDNFACFAKPGHVVLSWTDDKENDRENYTRCRVASLKLQSEKDAKGRPLTIHKLYLPPPIFYTTEEAESLKEGTDDNAAAVREPGERMAASYCNFYIANNAIIVPQFGCNETDEAALETLKYVFAGDGRLVVGVPSREILIGGGNIHCITQQVPAKERR